MLENAFVPASWYSVPSMIQLPEIVLNMCEARIAVMRLKMDFDNAVDLKRFVDLSKSIVVLYDTATWEACQWSNTFKQANLPTPFTELVKEHIL